MLSFIYVPLGWNTIENYALVYWFYALNYLFPCFVMEKNRVIVFLKLSIEKEKKD